MVIYYSVLRLGRCVDTMYSSLLTMHLPDPTMRVTITFSRIASSLYLLCDHILWLGKSGLVKVDNNNWSKLSNKFWLYSITMNLIRDFYEIIRIYKVNNLCNLNQRYYFSNVSPHHERCISANNQTAIERAIYRMINWIIRHKDVSSDTLKNFCDFWIPMNSLGHVNLSPGTIGLLGAVSSTISILQILDYTFRLSPS